MTNNTIVRTNPSHSKFQKYINMMTIMTNCLTSKKICKTLLMDQNHYLNDELGRTLHWFHSNLHNRIEYYKKQAQGETRVRDNFSATLLLRQLQDLDNEVMLGQYLL